MIIVEIESQVDYYELHPPSALNGLVAHPIEIDYPFDSEDGTVDTVFELACRCGNTLFETGCVIYDGDVCPPIVVTCSNCEYSQVIYDPNFHGYACVVDGNRWSPGPGAHDSGLECEEVDSPCHIIVRYEYPEGVLANEGHDGIEHDLYTSITILARDPDDGVTGFLFDDET